MDIALIDVSFSITYQYANNNNKLKALRECRPPWPRQIITLILPTVKMLNLGCERLPTPLKKKKKKKRFWIIFFHLHHDLGMLPLLRCFFAHLLILQYPDHHQNLISSSLYYSGPVHKISSQSAHNFLSNVVHRQTDKLTNATKNITSFAKEVKISMPTKAHVLSFHYNSPASSETHNHLHGIGINTCIVHQTAMEAIYSSESFVHILLFTQGTHHY